MDGHAEKVDALRRAVLETPGATDRALREAAFRGVEVPQPWAHLVELVREASYRVTDADLASLVGAGLSEDAVFEMTLAAALGAAATRLDAGLRALDAAEAG
jgi:hypothetical protein